MAHGFKESDFQHGAFIPYLTAPRPEGLDWILGKPANIDQARWLVPADQQTQRIDYGPGETLTAGKESCNTAHAA